MISKPPINDKIIAIAGAFLLVGIMAAGWLPRNCSLVRNAVIGCHASLPPAPLTPEEEELSRIPHQDVAAGFATFSTAAGSVKDQTLVNFYYRPEAADEVAYLQVKYPSGFRNLALITHPLLRTLSWPTVSEDGLLLYQRNGTASSIQEALATHPTPDRIAVDSIAAASLGLPSDSYTALEPLTSLGPLDYVLTSMPARQMDGTWVHFIKQFDLTGAEVSSQNTLEWMIERKGSDLEDPFRIDTIHVDYKLQWSDKKI